VSKPARGNTATGRKGDSEHQNRNRIGKCGCAERKNRTRKKHLKKKKKPRIPRWKKTAPFLGNQKQGIREKKKKKETTGEKVTTTNQKKVVAPRWGRGSKAAF